MTTDQWFDILEDRMEVLSDRLATLQAEVNTLTELIAIQNGRVCNLEGKKAITLLQSIFEGSDEEMHDIIMELDS